MGKYIIHIFKKKVYSSILYIICHNVIFLSTRQMFFLVCFFPNFSQRANQLSTTLRSEPAASLPQGSEETKTDLVQRKNAAGLLFWLVRCNHFFVFFFSIVCSGIEATFC